MKLYHGTNYIKLEKILKNGISPRRDKKSVWKKAPSRTDMVYLTTAYSFYFAFCAAEEKEKEVVFEIDTDFLNIDKLFPDEDFIWEATGKKLSHKEIKNDLESYQQHWLKSIERLGNCSYQGIITPEAITRYCVFDSNKHSVLTISILDPTITILNYKIKGEYYKNITAWIFGDIIELPQVKENEIFYEQMPHRQFKQGIKFWQKESNNRNGIEITRLKH